MRFKLTEAMAAIAYTMNHHRLRPLLLGLMICAPLCSFAEAPPPFAPFDAISRQVTLKRKPATGLRMGAFQVRFESTTLDDIRRAASAGEIAHQGDAGESAYWLCYANLGELREWSRQFTPSRADHQLLASMHAPIRRSAELIGAKAAR